MARKPSDRAKLLISIVNTGDTEKLTAALGEVTRCLHYTFVCKGTAKPAVTDFLGLTEKDKSIVLSVIPESQEQHLLRAAVKSLKLYLAGKGIAFTMPLTSISTLIANAVKTDAVRQKGENKMDDSMRYEAIIAVYKQEFSDKVLSVARSAGAVGGTLIHSRTLSSTGVEQFVGISLGEETEILLILTKKAERNDIMRAIRDSAGLKTDGSAVVLSIPVDALVGIGSVSDEYRDE